MRIAWIADYTVETYKSGGAQYTNQMYIEEGRKRGHYINILTKEFNLIDTYDFYILNNITCFFLIKMFFPQNKITGDICPFIPILKILF